jgi:predicted dehydrogenase
MQTAPKVTVALIGCGSRGVQALGRAAREAAALDLLAVCDLDAARLRAAAAALEVPAERDYRRLLDRPDLHAVIVATNARAHARIALDAIRAGKHVLVEKPLADTAGAAREVVRAAHYSGVVGMVGYQVRFSGFGEALEREAHAVDAVQLVVTRQRGPMNPVGFTPDHSAGIMDAATHSVHQMMVAMGGPPQSVYASVTRGTILGDETLEFVNLLMEYDGGRRTALLATSMLGFQVPGVVQVVGTRGTVSSLDRRTLRVLRHDPVTVPGARAEPPGLAVSTIETTGEARSPDGRDATAAMLERFAGLVADPERGQRLNTLAEGAAAVAVTEAMVQAAAQGRRLPLASLYP